MWFFGKSSDNKSQSSQDKNANSNSQSSGSKNSKTVVTESGRKVTVTEYPQTGRTTVVEQTPQEAAKGKYPHRTTITNPDGTVDAHYSPSRNGDRTAGIPNKSFWFQNDPDFNE